MGKRKRLLLLLLSGWLIFCVVWFFTIYQKDEKKSTNHMPVSESPQVPAITPASVNTDSIDIPAIQPAADSNAEKSQYKEINDTISYAAAVKANSPAMDTGNADAATAKDEIEKNKITLPATGSGENKKLSVCYFYQNSNKKIKNFSYRQAKEILQSVTSPDAKITVTGHTDYIGSAEYNYNLGLQRAERVKQLLIKKGIAPERIVVLSKGEEEPIAGNGSAGGRAKNRRVEINITFS
jgi:outer membrane protein OmpA-like peptidoglycan-associated protein